MYDSKQKQLIHELLETTLSEEELDSFCQDHFPDITERFAADMSMASKIRTLIETCDERNQLGKLVLNIQKAKPEEYQSFVDQVKKPPQRPRESTKTFVRTAPPTVTAFPVESISDPPARRDRGDEIILNAEALISQSLVGRYQIDEVLDKSGLGAVFKAYDTKLELQVAIKVIDLNRVKQRTIQERVRQEVRTAMQLDHPGIVKVYDFGQNESLLYIIMEYIPGYNLRQARQYFKTLDSKIALPQVIRLFQEICLIVDHMHQQRVLHPGTKPENVMIKQGQATEEAAWRPILINLGLLRPNKETVMSRDPITVRRLTYTVSPELLLGHATDIRSDVYALGVLLYDLAVGEPPFRPSNLTEAVRFHVETPVPTPRSINPVISEELEAIILKALAKNPADRYLSAKGMAQALAACLDAASLPAPAPKSEVSVLVEAQSLAVNPGESVSTTITLDNKGTLDDRCQIKITGIPEEWVALSPSVTTLQPGSQQEVQLTIQPPLSPQSRAGRHSVAVQVISEHGSKQIDQIRKVLIIAPYSQATRTLWPQEISTGQVSQVTIENHGNTTESFTIRPKPDGALKFQPEENRLKINPGESGQVDFRVTSRRQLLIAQRMTQTFSLDVISVDGRVDTLSGQVVSQGILKPSLVFGIVTVFLLFLCGVLILFFSVRSLPGAPTATLDARQTFDARTAIAIAVATEVGTATADWLSQDIDGDGLSNSEELALRTSPTDLDTDGDNLPDGAEVEILGTDPTLKDSDFDGIPDDEEVRNIWNPEDRDTDKDGTPDAFDEFPGLAPTATPRAQATPIASGTPMLHSVGFSDPQPFLNQANLFGIFTFGSPNSYVIAENAGSAVIEVEITPPASRQIQVNYSVEGSSASMGQDFSLTGSTIVFQSGDNHQTFQVNITDDTTAEGSETIFLVLRDPSPGVVISNPRIELVIADND